VHQVVGQQGDEDVAFDTVCFLVVDGAHPQLSAPLQNSPKTTGLKL
jgi:hypothetical protein